MQNTDSTLLGILEDYVQRPCNTIVRNILADYLDDCGREKEAKLTRLCAELLPLWEAPWEIPDRRKICDEINTLILCENVRPVVPTYTDNHGIEFVFVPPGVFRMGSPLEEEGRYSNEAQSTQVVNVPFWMSKNLITQEQYERVTGKNPAYFKNLPESPIHPIETVSWYDMVEFTKILSKNGDFYFPPPEEWFEYSCRAGTPTPYHFGEVLLPEYANFRHGKSPNRTTPVGIYPPNGFGLHDMHGNLWEWCLNEYFEIISDSPPPSDAVVKMLKGGEWDDSEFFDI